jgi:hypothetical protein
VIHNGRTMHYGPEQDTYVFFRYDDNRRVMVALNKNERPVTLPTSRFHEMLAGVRTGTDVITGVTYHLDGSVTLPARTAVILELQ